MMMSTKEAASYLGISYYYLRNMRQELHNHEGPFFSRMKNGPCFYQKEDLDLWKSSHSWRPLHQRRSRTLDFYNEYKNSRRKA